MIPALIITIVLLLLSGYFSASETSLFSIGREQFDALSKGDAADRAIFTLLSRGEDTLIVILLANLVVNLLIISSLSKLLTLTLDPSLFMKMIYSTAILLIFGEVIPKNVALALSKKISRFSAPKLLFLLEKLGPVIGLFKKVNRSLIRFNYRFILQKPLPFVTTAEYKSALQRTVQEGQLSKESATFLGDFLHFSEGPLLAAAVHRSEVQSIAHQDEYGGKGIALVMNTNDEVHQIVTGTAVEEPLWYPSTGSIGDFLAFLKGNSRTSALLVDEYGTYYGAASVQSVLRLWRDSHQEQVSSVTRITLKGSESVVKYSDWFPDEMLAAFPDIKTVSGLVTSWFGKIPESGTVLTMESCIFQVIKSDGRTIKTLNIKKRSS